LSVRRKTRSKPQKQKGMNTAGKLQTVVWVHETFPIKQGKSKMKEKGKWNDNRGGPGQEFRNIERRIKILAKQFLLSREWAGASVRKRGRNLMNKVPPKKTVGRGVLFSNAKKGGQKKRVRENANKKN